MDPEAEVLHEVECPARGGAWWCSLTCYLMPAPIHEPAAAER